MRHMRNNSIPAASVIRGEAGGKCTTPKQLAGVQCGREKAVREDGGEVHECKAKEGYAVEGVGCLFGQFLLSTELLARDGALYSS